MTNALPPLLPLAMPILIGLLSGAAMLVGLEARAYYRPVSRRARALALTSSRRGCGPKVQRLLALLEFLLGKLGLGGDEQRRQLSDRLVTAGLKGKYALLSFQTAQATGPVVGLLLGWLGWPLLLGPEAQLQGGIMGLGGGYLLPRLWLRNRGQKRMARLSRSFPDMLDLQLICTEAGLGLDAALARVARELGPAAPDLAEELHLLSVELGFLPNRAEAFANFHRRAPLPEVQAMVALMQQTERFGTPLAEALRHLAADCRTQAMMRTEERAARLPAIMTVPMILFILPPLFIVLVGPAILQLMG